jgi:hypothetical protein
MDVDSSNESPSLPPVIIVVCLPRHEQYTANTSMRTSKMRSRSPLIFLYIYVIYFDTNIQAMYICYNPRVIIQNLLIAFLFVLIIILIWSCGNQSFGNKKNRNKGTEGYLDYMPSAIEPCPSHYKCGAASINQVAMENDLFNNLRESEKYASDPLMTQDQCCVLAKDSEPTDCMMKRNAAVRENSLPEGMYTPRDEMEKGLMKQGDMRV